MIHPATQSDVASMVQLSHQKRENYQKAQPTFWKMTDNSDAAQTEWFLSEIKKDDVIALCYENNLGFIIGKLITPPEVYCAGLTLMIDDFCVSNNQWQIIGKELLQECIKQAKIKNAQQILVVCGNHDVAKQKLLDEFGLGVVSNWYVKEI